MTDIKLPHIVVIDGLNWQVSIADDGRCIIRDSAGEAVYRGDSHDSTATHLAMALAEVRKLSLRVVEAQREAAEVAL